MARNIRKALFVKESAGKATSKFGISKLFKLFWTFRGKTQKKTYESKFFGAFAQSQNVTAFLKESSQKFESHNAVIFFRLGSQQKQTPENCLLYFLVAKLPSKAECKKSMLH